MVAIQQSRISRPPDTNVKSLVSAPQKCKIYMLMTKYFLAKRGIIL